MTLWSKRPHEAGVTLVEMLVALSLFALVGLASFATLDAIVKARVRTEGRLEAVTEIDRTLLLFSRDMTQASPGAVRGDAAAVLIGPQDATVSWALRDGTLVRQRADLLRDQTGPEQRLLSGIARVRVGYLDAVRNWHDAWPDDTAQGALIGVELTLERDGVGGTIRRLVALVEDGL